MRVHRLTAPHRDLSAAGIFNFLSSKCPRARLVCKHANSAARATLLRLESCQCPASEPARVASVTLVIFNFFQLSGKCLRAWARLEVANSAARATLTCRSCDRLKSLSLSLIPLVIRLMGCSCHDSYIGTKANYSRVCTAGPGAWTSFDLWAMT